MSLDELIIKLHEVEAVKFGCFTLKSGIQSPIYFDLRVIVSYPKLMENVAKLMRDLVKTSECKFDSICGVPYTALPIATVMAVQGDHPMLIRRKEAKSYGTKKMIEGKYKNGDTCLIIEDVVTSGSSVLETVQSLKDESLEVKDAFVLMDREQGGAEKLKSEGIKLHSVCTLTKLCQVLQEAGKLSEETVQQVQQFILENNTFQPNVDKKVPPPKPTSIFDKFGSKFTVKSYKERSSACKHPLSKKLFKIMAQKETNLALSADLMTCSEVLKLADEIGPYICILKTHVDIIQDFTLDFTKKLRQLADKHNFLIFEDRKFADIGHTVKEQYEGGMYRIVEWADIITAHVIPGPGIIQGLQQVGQVRERGCVLLAQMSSKGNLAVEGYTKACVQMATEHKDFVMGFICQEILSDDPDMVHLTPGIQMGESGDNFGQQYSTPYSVVMNNGSDIIIVGRGITKAPDPAQAAREYKAAGYQAHQDLLQLFNS